MTVTTVAIIGCVCAAKQTSKLFERRSAADKRAIFVRDDDKPVGRRPAEIVAQPTGDSDAQIIGHFRRGRLRRVTRQRWRRRLGDTRPHAVIPLGCVGDAALAEWRQLGGCGGAPGPIWRRSLYVRRPFGAIRPIL